MKRPKLFSSRVLIGALTLLVGLVTWAALRTFRLAAANVTIPAQFFVINDVGGPDDVAGQKDITRMGRYEDNANNTLDIFWSWDDINPTSQSFDACALFDSNSNGKIDYAICAQIINSSGSNSNPIPKLNPGYPKVYKCSDTDTVHCVGYSSNPQPSVPSLQAGDLIGLNPNTELTTNTDPFPPTKSNGHPYDTTLRVRFNKSELPGAKLANVCTYPSASIDSAVASDCIVNPGGGFLSIVKNTTTGNGTFTFDVNPVPNANSGGPCDPLVAGCQSYSVTTSGNTGSVGLSMAISPNAVSVKERDPFPAWVLANASCQIEGDGTTGTLNANTLTVSGITILPSTITTCTFTNSKAPAHLTVTKVVVNDNGGTASVGNYTLMVGDTPATSGVSANFSEGTYQITESGGPSGYTASFSGNCNSSGQITVSSGQTYTCTITNNDNPPSLILSKIVDNGNGGTVSATSFTLSASGPTPISGSGGVSSGANFAAGSYTLSETGPAGYAAGAWRCTGGVQNGNQITLGIAQSGSCTITNDDIQPKLIVKKHVINNNGGTKVASNFTMSVTGAAASPNSFAGSEAGTTVALNAGSYSVSESGPAGYGATYSADCSGTIAVGETKTCMVTNDDAAGTLTVIKHVINNNGGTATADQWTMHLTAVNPSNNDFAGSESGVQISIDAGSYSVDETGGPGSYAKTLGAGCSGTMTSGGTATCVITNDDIQPRLIVQKHVIHDNGGTNVASDFTMSVTGAAASPSSFAGSEAGTTVALNAGSYSVGESGPIGYAATYSADCSGTIDFGQTKTCTVTNDDAAGTLTVIKHVINNNGASASADQFTMHVTAGQPTGNDFAGSESGVQISIDAGRYNVDETGGPGGYAKTVGAGCSGTMTSGGSATCIITNDDMAPRLTLTKVVVNNNGGTAAPGAWTVSAAGPDPISGAGSAASGSTFLAGAYTLSESAGPAGYTASSWACTGTGTQNGNQITLQVGQTAACTITNDDIPPSLTLVKNVSTGFINDPAAPPSAFTVRTTGGPANISGPGAASSGPNFKAGTYTLAESGPGNYTPSAWVCSGQGTQSNNSITLGIAQTATCAITNTLNNIPPSVKVDKTASPRNLDSSGGAVTFTVTVTNLGGSYDPYTITSLTDTIYGDLTNPADAKPQDNNTCGNAVGTVIPGGGSYSCSWTSLFPPLPANQTLSEHDVVTVVGQDDDNAGASSVGTASDDATVTQMLPIVITNGTCEIDQYTRIFTQDYAYHFTATNNGQFFYNVSIAGIPGEKRHVTLELPWPFVTQGSQPIHVYDGVEFVDNCFKNFGGGYAIDSYVYLKDYGVFMGSPDPGPYQTGYPAPSLQPSLKTTKVELEITIPSTGFAFIRQHMDDGLKGPWIDVDGNGVYDDLAYGTDGADNALDPATGNILIPEKFIHPFSMWGFKCSFESPACNPDLAGPDVSFSGGTTLTNDNQYQKNVGVGGVVLYNALPVPGMTVELRLRNSLIGAAITDSNGLYSIAHKDKSKADDYTVTLVNPLTNASVLSGGVTISGMPGSTTKPVNIKPNGFVIVDFPLVP